MDKTLWIDTLQKKNNEWRTAHENVFDTVMHQWIPNVKPVRQYFTPTRKILSGKTDSNCEMWSNWNPHTLLVGANDTTVGKKEKCDSFFPVKCMFTIWPSSSAHRYLPKWNESTCMFSNLHMYVHSSIILNSQNLKTA